jgi:hypothetical protein
MCFGATKDLFIWPAGEKKLAPRGIAADAKPVMRRAEREKFTFYAGRAGGRER